MDTVAVSEARIIEQVRFLSAHSAERVHVRSGDTYVFTCDCSTRAGHVHPRDSLLYVHDSTTDAPFDEIGPKGINWWCRTQFGISVWATLEQCIERGILKRLS